MIITIGGPAGSGTSTTSHILSEKTGIPYISAGDVFRQMARDPTYYLKKQEYPTYLQGMSSDRWHEKGIWMYSNSANSPRETSKLTRK